MSVDTSTISVPTHDGGVMPSRLALPESGSGPGVLVLHEIFGVNEYMDVVLGRLAGLGYVGLCADLFWRIDPGHALPQDEAGMARAMARMADFDLTEATRDSESALGALTRLDEVTGPVAVLGFCLGGTLAFASAINGSPDAVVSYYGTGVVDLLDQADRVDCPILFHFGNADPFLPTEHADRVEAAYADRDDVEVCRYEAGHAFDNLFAPQFHDPAAAEAAWGATADFLRRHLG